MIMAFNEYRKLVDSSSQPYKNFLESIKFSKRAIYFNYILSMLIKENIDYEVIQGFDYLSNDENINSFKKVIIKTEVDIDYLLENNLVNENAKIIKNNLIYEILLND